jgi:ribonuclease R
VDDDALKVVAGRSGDVVALGDRMIVEIVDAAILRRTVYGRRIGGEGDGKKGVTRAERRGGPGQGKKGRDDRNQRGSQGGRGRPGKPQKTFTKGGSKPAKGGKGGKRR